MDTADSTTTSSEQARAPSAPKGIRRFFFIAGSWVGERTGIRSARDGFLNHSIPLYVQRNILYALGGLTVTSFLLQIASGITMAFYYAPSIESAYASVDYITYVLPAGWLVRGIHVYNSSIIFILLFLHLLHTFFTSSYKKPREISWLTGVILLLITVGFAFTGALLPWDQHGYWATIVGSEIAGSTPLAGEWLARLMRGGTLLGQTTLTRFYVTHIIILPVTFVGLVGLHLSQVLRHGAAPPITKKGQASAGRSIPYFPNRLFVHTVLGLGLLALVIVLSWNQRAPLEFEADPTSTNYIPRPKWYFLSLFQLLHYFPGKWEPIASMLIPGLVIGSMFLLPFLDRSEERRPWRKPLTTTIGLIYLVMIVLLTLIALNSPA